MDGHDPMMEHTHWYNLVLILKYCTPFGPIAEAIYYHPDPIQREECTTALIFIFVVYPITIKFMWNTGAPYICDVIVPEVSNFINRALR